MNHRRAVYALLLILLILFLCGFFLGEDALGGGIRLDLYHYHGPAMFAFRNYPWKTVLADYTSATTPLFQILESYNPLLGHDTAFRAFNVFVGLFTVYLFVIALTRRFSVATSFHHPATLIGASFLLSPYFRAETFWVSTDILPLLLTIVCGILLTPWQEATLSTSTEWRAIPRIALLALLSWAAFYCRQIYAFLPAYTFLVLFLQRRKERWFTVLIFTCLALPGAWLFSLWKGFNPPAFHSHQRISSDGFVAPLSMIFVYSIPFVVYAVLTMRPTLDGLWRRARRYVPWLAIGWLFFLVIFHRYQFSDINHGGGVASKLLSPFGVPGTFAFLTCGYLGLLIIIFLFRTSRPRTGFFIVLALLPACAISIVFQRYYDPSLVVLFFLFMEKHLVQRFVTMRMAAVLLLFNALLLVSALAVNAKGSPVFFPITSSHHPWTGTPLDGKVR